MSIQTWNRCCPTFFGTGASDLVAEKAQELGMHKIMFITEQFLMSSGIASRVKELLDEAGFEVVVWDKIVANPTDILVDEGTVFAKENGFDGIVSIGGGSSLDTAKAIALMTGNPGNAADYFPGRPAASNKLNRGIPIICMPTTSGTGAENSPWCVISDHVSHEKLGLVYVADIALVDPVLTYSVPASVTAATGLDALAHCLEAITTKGKNYFVDALGKEGIRLVFEWLPIAVAEPQNEKAREMMAVAANYGGMVISYCSTNFGHAFGEAFGGQHHEPHGLCCSWGTPGTAAVAALYAPEDARIAAEAMGIPFDDATTPQELCDAMVKKVQDLAKICHLPTPQEKGYTLDDFLGIAEILYHSVPFAGAPAPEGGMSFDEAKRYIELCYHSFE